jgi:ferric-dicitrate binding protein FerR (iron transport regulator)
MTPDSDRSIEQLIKLAGERDMPSREGMDRARIAAQESFRRMLDERPRAKRSRLRSAWGFGLAAGVAAVVLYSGIQRPASTSQVQVASVAAFEGVATLLHPGGETAVLAAAPIHSGTTLVTREGRIALTFGDTVSLRADRHTRLRFDGRERITLFEGALYVDSGGVNAVPALRIGTPAGEVRHVGTQFQVSVSGETTQVRVREGRVLLTRAAGAQADIVTGDEVRVRGEDLEWRHALPSFGPDWEWSATIAPPLSIESRPLSEFLSWMVREQGWQLRYGDQALQASAQDIRLHGSLEGLAAGAMLERVSLVTGVPLRADGGVLWVGEVRP